MITKISILFYRIFIIIFRNSIDYFKKLLLFCSLQTYYFRCGQNLNFHPASCSSSSACSDRRYGGLSLRLKYDSNIHRHLPFLKMKYMIFRVIYVVHSLIEETLIILSQLILSITEFCFLWLLGEVIIHVPYKHEPIRLRFYILYGLYNSSESVTRFY